MSAAINIQEAGDEETREYRRGNKLPMADLLLARGVPLACIDLLINDQQLKRQPKVLQQRQQIDAEYQVLKETMTPRCAKERLYAKYPKNIVDNVTEKQSGLHWQSRSKKIPLHR